MSTGQRFVERWPELFEGLSDREVAATVRALSSMGEGGWEVGFEEVKALTDVSRGAMSREEYWAWAGERAHTLATGES